MKAHIEGASAEQRATPDDYRVIFESPAGSLVLDDLVRRFTGSVFVRGGHDGERETTYRLGRRDVVEHIISMINRANGAEPEGE
ncbi:hypothetical protein K6W16_10410 [Burkholderia dolosa]|uniref:Bbp19-like phage domain-containing protein n=1 Tax=Burkholderia dolosa TaxID=152500 RepID=A0A892I469_9BURK|nr:MULTISPECIES: hypothetical protein [Burkholderia]AKE03035.1 hypothetical protein XM57_08825 [Burkholderia cepacia]AJY11857.1 hypothetical protein AK34_722 [Burkholderia dolosa AU0158]AYZ97789.1 hypothetical protein EGY28_22780 [Burkholderia dolosa]ETP64858.1 hypothetical protein BDSB_05480 [Burkholderia dolosa PC543]MBR8419808.1 hypothetical protein [Burkholderia dolosa]